MQYGGTGAYWEPREESAAEGRGEQGWVEDDTPAGGRGVARGQIGAQGYFVSTFKTNLEGVSGPKLDEWTLHGEGSRQGRTAPLEELLSRRMWRSMRHKHWAGE